MVDEFEFDKRNSLLRPEARQPGEISQGGVAKTVAAPADYDKTVILTTKRLTLRPPEMRDVDALVSLANNPKIANSLGNMPHPYGREDGHFWINELSKPEYFKRSFALTDRLNDEFLGAGNFRLIEGEDDKIQIGFWLGEPYWGQGLAAEAVQAMIDKVFENDQIQSVWASCRPANYQSKRVIEKCGFQYVYHGMGHSLTETGPFAIDYYAITRSTWESLHSWGRGSF